VIRIDGVKARIVSLGEDTKLPFNWSLHKAKVIREEMVWELTHRPFSFETARETVFAPSSIRWNVRFGVQTRYLESDWRYTIPIMP